MKARFFVFISIMCACAVFCGCMKKSLPSERTLTVYAYDSFVAEWGPGPQLAELFEKQTGIRVELISCGDAAQVLSRAVFEKDNPQADVLVGIDNQLASQAERQGIIEPYAAQGIETIPPRLRFERDMLTPYDWSCFAMIWDSESDVKAPRSLADLTKPEYAKKIILLDPRTSTPGLGFIAWTLAVCDDSFADFWRALKPNILTMAPGWDSGYGLFTAGEAPFVISYTTSPAYHFEQDGSERYKALIFGEGHIAQIEGAALVKNAKHQPEAKAFLDFLLGEGAQSVLPLTQWMYPVNPSVALPKSFDTAPVPDVLPEPDYDKVEQAVAVVLSILAE